jgi:hypothetical protein
VVVEQQTSGLEETHWKIESSLQAGAAGQGLTQEGLVGMAEGKLA